MSTPKDPAAYPPAMLAAVDRAIALGKFSVPTTNPAKLRLQFYGLASALRRENRAGEIDRVSFHIVPDGLEIRLKADEDIMRALDAALGGDTLPASADALADSLFSNLAKGV
jgi:hypothetical protein